MKVVKISILGGAVAAALAMGVAQADAPAASPSTTLNAATSVAAKCTTLTANAITFDAYVPDEANDNTKDTTVTVKCTLNTPITIAMDKGTNGSSTSARKLKITDGTHADTLSYNLYSNAGRTTLWGEGSDKVSKIGEGLLMTSTYNVYGKIPAAQDVTPGSYADAVTVTVAY